MNEFEQRWKQAAAHLAKPLRDDAAPFGFSTRVVAKWRAQPSLATVWQRIALRFCTALAILVAVLASFDALTAGEGDALRPDIERTVDELFWAL